MTDDNWTTLQSAGKVPPPSPEVLAHAAQRVEAARDTRRRIARRRVLVPVLAATATAAVIGVVALERPSTPTAIPVTTPSSSATYPPSRSLGNPNLSPSCAVSYSAVELAKQEFGFDGTVLSAKPIPRTAYFWAVTFQVHEWYRPGRGAGQVTVQMLGGPDPQQLLSEQPNYKIGDRLLMSGSMVDSRTGNALKYPAGWGCGFTRMYDVPTADTWRKVFSK
ncbi:hypothetical protein ABZS29_00035 [Kribbella sp. NPDC005582]|uniref:hypothetical protein n=1 Tax=Kribbella sp. NPDC005582 TaxID=3156893 RepID=UPI0033A79E11